MPFSVGNTRKLAAPYLKMSARLKEDMEVNAKRANSSTTAI